jgi:hypothetical protein
LKNFSSTKINGTYFFVCTHNTKSLKCGTCGPRLYQVNKNFKKIKELSLNLEKEKSIKEETFVKRCSHIGGHKYAGNVIVWKAIDDQYVGDWFGYVSIEDVNEKIIKEYILNNNIPKDIYRGRFGTSN